MSNSNTRQVMFQNISHQYQAVDIGRLRAYQFPQLADTDHAVFTRLGGVSQAPWHALNMSYSVNDVTADVVANIALACAAMNVDMADTATCHLVHGNRVILAHPTADMSTLEQADGLISRTPGLMLTIRYADCPPLLFYDSVTPAVGLSHAGWRGTMQNVAQATVNAMVTEFGSRPENISMVIGPSIGPCCYEVGNDVKQEASRAFEHLELLFPRYNGAMHFDVWAANEQQARDAGITDVIVSGLCTACRTDEFFSHRAEKGRTGRFGVFLGLPKDGVL